MTVSAASDERGLEKPLSDLRSVLIAGETAEAWAIQRRIFAITHRRLLVAATSGRLIVITRPLLGGFELVSVRWQDLEEVTLRVGVLGADLGIRAGRATDLASSAPRARSEWCSWGCARSRRRPCTASARHRTRHGARNAACASSRSCAPGRA